MTSPSNQNGCHIQNKIITEAKVCAFDGRHSQCKFGSQRQRFGSHGFGKQFKEEFEDPAVETDNSSITEDIVEKVNEKSDSNNVKQMNKSNDEAEQCNDERVN